MFQTKKDSNRMSLRVLVATAIALMFAGFSASQASAIELLTLGASADDVFGTPVRQAGAHPDVTLKFTLPQQDPADEYSYPVEPAHQFVADLPPGLVGDPTAVDACAAPLLQGGHSGNRATCPVGSQVGYAKFRMGADVPVYNMERPVGAPAMFGFNVVGVVVKLTATVRPGRYNVTIDSGTISQGMEVFSSEVTLWGVPADPAHDFQRYGPSDLGYDAPATSQSPRKAFISTPTSCPGTPEVTSVKLDGWDSIGQFATGSFSSDFNGVPFISTGCEKLPFAPSIDVSATSRVAAGPTGLDVDVAVPQSDAPDGLATAHVKDVSLVLPQGMSINPSAANGLQACSDEQFDVASDAVDACPDAAKIGSVSVRTPVLEDPLEGSMYVASQQSDDPQSGRMFRMFMTVAGSGVRLKIEGSVKADPVTGRLTASFIDNPQLPFETLRVKLFGGSRAVLVNPSSCGDNAATATISSWSGKTVDLGSSFPVDCTAGQGGFAPTLQAGTGNPAAGAFSPFGLHIAKPDNNADLTGLSMVLPAGLLAQLKGNVGTQVGSVTAFAGPGASPFALPGQVYLEGAYGDAPFSLRVVVPAKAGPFDLGTVEVRQKIYVDPVTAQVTVVSDPLPTIVKGVPVRLQRLDVNVDKPGFIVNPTSCAPKAFGGTLSSADRQTAPINVRFQVGGCAGLGYEPELSMTMVGKGQTKDGSHPALHARLTPPPSNANTKKTTVTLPLALALDPGNANGLCEPADAARNTCPANTVVGSAQAQSILPDTLKGPVYFVRGERIDSKGKVRKTLPKLFIPLSANGVTIYVNASSDVEDDRLVTTFDNLPDAPFSSFELNINGGEHGILAVSGTNVCAATQVADAAFGGQNGKVHTSKVTMGTPCALGVVKSGRTSTALKLTVGGLGAGKVSGSGNGVVKSSRTLTSATTATLSLKLAKPTRRALARGRDVKVKVKVAFTAKGQKKAKRVTKTVVLHGSKKR
jgi:hypothetical protein